MDGMRFEYKYQIGAFQAEALRYRLGALLRTDLHAGASGRYAVRSLYFDDRQGSAYYEKLAGVAVRCKYRIRFYDFDPSYIVFEAKRKFGQTSKKSAVRITRETAERMAAGRPLDGIALRTPLLAEYEALAASRGLAPSVVVDYDRTPFVYPYSNARITLDRNISADSWREGTLFERRASVPAMDPALAILEVKFDRELAPFLAGLLADVPKILCANSKYCCCHAAIK